MFRFEPKRKKRRFQSRVISITKLIPIGDDEFNTAGTIGW
jgi:hypothetical protein